MLATAAAQSVGLTAQGLGRPCWRRQVMPLVVALSVLAIGGIVGAAAGAATFALAVGPKAAVQDAYSAARRAESDGERGAYAAEVQEARAASAWEL